MVIHQSWNDRVLAEIDHGRTWTRQRAHFGIRSDRDELIALDGKRFSNGRAGIDSDDLAVIENLVGDEGRSLLSKQPAGYNACDKHQNEGNSCSSKVHVVIYSNKGGFATSS